MQICSLNDTNDTNKYVIFKTICNRSFVPGIKIDLAPIVKTLIYYKIHSKISFVPMCFCVCILFSLPYKVIFETVLHQPNKVRMVAWNISWYRTSLFQQRLVKLRLSEFSTRVYFCIYCLTVQLINAYYGVNYNQIMQL